MPARKIRHADVADLAGSHEVIEGAEDLLDRREGVEPVELEEIDVVGAQSPKAGVNGADEMKPRRADVVRIPAMTKTGLRGDEHAIAPGGDGSAEDLFRLPIRVQSALSNMLSPASRHTSTRRVASATATAPQGLKNSLPPPNVPVPRVSTGTKRPDPPSCLNSMCAFVRSRQLVSRSSRQAHRDRPAVASVRSTQSGSVSSRGPSAMTRKMCAESNQRQNNAGSDDVGLHRNAPRVWQRYFSGRLSVYRALCGNLP